MMAARNGYPCLVAACLLAMIVIADFFYNQRPAETIWAPLLSTGLIAIAAIIAMFAKVQPGLDIKSAAPVRVKQPRSIWFFAAPIAALVLWPRVGIPLLAFAIARYRKVGVAKSAMVLLLSVVITETAIWAGFIHLMPNPIFG